MASARSMTRGGDLSFLNTLKVTQTLVKLVMTFANAIE